MKRSFFFVFLQVFVYICLISQPAFIIDISSEHNDYTGDLVEDSPGQYLIVGFSGNYWQPETYRSFIYRINSIGDTIGKHFYLPDTIFLFDKISKFQDDHYIVFGSCANAPEYNEDFMVMILDENLETISYKRYHFAGYNDYPGVNILNSNNNYYVCASIRNKQTNIYHSLLLKINDQGDTINSRIINDLGDAQHVGDIELSSDRKLWIFGDGFNNSSGGSRIIYDTLFNYIRSHFFPEFEGMNMNAKWITDSTLLFGAKYLHLGSYPQDDDIGISETDTSFLNLDIHYFGSIDTIDYPAWGKIIGFQNEDSIYYAGTHNLIFDFWPEWPSWILFGQLDRELDKRFEYYYGGDAYYQALDIIATSDGGCLISALKYDYTTQYQENDIIVLKYNIENLITDVPEHKIKNESNILVYPNPGINQINIYSDISESQVLIYSIDGQLVFQNGLKSGLNSISLLNFKPGMYIYRIVLNNEIIKQDKWIKLH
ncbi:MAG: T9SS type A sorting domain-containing protein [Bacteroidales bacterium]|nr:T9SS type A sorting domain-containing protein [Bacteroidales bacterium]